MAAAHQLPHMPAADLEQFLADSAAELNVTPLDADVFRLRRRRRSLEQHFDADDAVAARVRRKERADVDAPYHRAKVVVVGDEMPAKLDAVSLFAAEAGRPATNSHTNRPMGSANAFEVFERAIPVSISAGRDGPEDATVSNTWDIEVWMPEMSELHKHYRAECFHGASAVVITFSVKSRGSLDNVHTKWAPEVTALLQALSSPGSPSVPVVLVGLEAEVRNAKGASPATLAIPAVEAVQTAQDMGAAKYMEVFSDNAFHIQEVFAQAAAAVAASRAESGLPDGYLRERAALQHAAFRETTKLELPQGSFDLVRRSFSVGVAPGVVVDLTVDGTDPRTSKTRRRYTGPLQFERPYPSVIRLVALSRARFASDVAEFDVPQDTEAPAGYFDALTKTLNLFTPVDSRIQLRYTLDGTEPNAHSPLYSGPVALDGPDSTPLGAWALKSLGGPRVAKVIAVGEGRFRSAVVTITGPPILDAPKIQYSAHTGTLVIESSAPAAFAEVRYTLDGTMPTTASTVYTRPIVLPKDAARTIRAACFPIMRFSSPEAVLETGGHDANRSVFTTNKSAMTRAQASMKATADDETPVLMAPGSRGISSRYKDPVSPARDTGAQGTPLRSSMRGGRGESPARTGTPRRGAPAGSPAATARGKSPAKKVRLNTSTAASSPGASRVGASTASSRIVREAISTVEETVSVTTPGRGVGSGPPSRGRIPPPPTAANTSAVPQQRDDSVQCQADENVVNFAFEKPISLSHITVATPGNARGPGMYEVYGRVDGDPEDTMQLVGAGTLDDFEGEQTIAVKPAARLQPVVHVRCVFIAPSSSPDAMFQINDLKVHGKPYRR